MLHGTWSICLVEIALWILIYGISKIAQWILAYAWIEKLDFIDDILSIYRILNGLEIKFNTDYRTGGISAKSAKYRFEIDKLAKKSSMKWHVEQWRKLVKILEIIGYIGKYIGYIADISGKYQRFFWKLFFFNFYLFNLFFILNLYYHFIFKYFLYLSHLCMTCSYL